MDPSSFNPDLFRNASGESNVHDALGIVLIEASGDRVVLEVPITWKVHQPYGILHGGVSGLIAESAASIGGALSVPRGKIVVGTELNCSHLRSVTEGTLRAVATPIRQGRSMQVWEIVLTDSDEREICRARCSLAVIDAPSSAG